MTEIWSAMNERPSSGAPEALAAPWLFASILDPISPAEFCVEHWGRRPLRIERGRPNFYRGLISLEELERYFSVDQLLTRQIVRLRARDYETFVHPETRGAIYEQLAAGRSLQVRKMESFVDPAAPVIALLRDMEQVLQHPKESLGCYVTPARGEGLGPHHDETEIFTLQISGAKRWRLFHRLNTDQPGIHRREDLGEPSLEIVLRAGELLYLPRGFVHEVVSEPEPSFSLTIVFQPLLWRSLLEALFEKLGSVDAFIEELPAGELLAEQAPEALSAAFEERLGAIRRELEALSIDQFMDGLAARQMAKMTPPPGEYLEGLLRSSELGLDTMLERRNGTCARVTIAGDKLTLMLPGGDGLTASARAEPALRAILAFERPFRVDEIPNSLSPAAKVSLAKKLVGCGLLEVRAIS